MSLYPSLEDMQVDQMAQAQVSAVSSAHAALTDAPMPAPAAGSLYADLGLEELMRYGGLDISQGALTQHVSQEVALAMQHQPHPSTALVSITPAAHKGMVRAQVKQGVRPITLAKDAQGKLGFAVKDIDKGLFVAFVWQNSAAALGGLRFGDQILQIDGEAVAGWSGKKALKVLQAADPTKVQLAVRDRPFERTVTVVKDSTNHVGFVFKEGEISAIVKDSSAARNGLLINHQMIEVNGQNVVGLNDKEALKIIQEADRSVTLTIMPTFVFKHLIKSIGFKSIKKFMDHGIPEL